MLQGKKLSNIFFLMVMLCEPCWASSGISDWSDPDNLYSLFSHPVVSLLGGYANTVAGHSQSATGSDSESFSYDDNASQNNTGFIGTFVGVERALPHPGHSLQLGLEYNYFWPSTVQGANSVGIEPATSTLYSYQYQVRTQQILVSAKYLATAYEHYHPYGYFGIGAAFNRSSSYQVSTSETGSVNLTPTFGNHNETACAVSVGTGIDVNVKSNLRLGLGYRFSYFGKASLGSGAVGINQYQAPVSFSLSYPHVYANQLMAQISYLA